MNCSEADVDPNAALLRIVIQAGSRISRQGNGEHTVGIQKTGRGQGRQQ